MDGVANLGSRLVTGMLPNQENHSTGCRPLAERRNSFTAPPLLLAARDIIENFIVERTCPKSWQLLFGTLLPKGAYNGSPMDLRIITLLSVWYRTWVSIVYRQATTWLAAWAPPEVLGGRPLGAPNVPIFALQHGSKEHVSSKIP